MILNLSGKLIFRAQPKEKTYKIDLNVIENGLLLINVRTTNQQFVSKISISK